MNLTEKFFPLGLSKGEAQRLTRAALGIFLAGFALQVPAAPALTPLYSFTSDAGGGCPSAGLVQGSDGNFYGTTSRGGSSGAGGIFKINDSGVLISLYSFTNGVDGALVAGPRPRLFQGRDGNFYGTTSCGGTQADGNVYRITPDGAFTVIYSFTNGTDGAAPSAGVVQGADGDFYGTTGGTDGRGAPANWGGIFKITPHGAFTPLHQFTNGADGATPTAALLLAKDGNFYGVTSNGGTNGDGAIFKITAKGALTPLYSFTNGVDGAIPTAGLVQASDGNFYGATYGGGTKNAGSIFKITPTGVLTALYSFTNGMDCAGPFAGVRQGGDGDFYGITRYGGREQAGGIFKMTADGSLTPLYVFTNGVDGGRPYGGLVLGSNGNLYGTTEMGGLPGVGAGTFFRLSLVEAQIAAAPAAPVAPVVPMPATVQVLVKTASQPSASSAKAVPESGIALTAAPVAVSSNAAPTHVRADTPKPAQSVTKLDAPVRPPPRPAALPVARVAGTDGSGLRLRSSAALSASVLAIIPDGSQVSLLGDTQTTDGIRWRAVQYGSLQGWTASEYLALGGASK